MSVEGYTEVFRGGFVEAEIVAELLKSNEIPVYIENEIMGTVMPWVLSPAANSPLRVYVQDKYLSNAHDLLKNEEYGSEDEE